MAQAVADQAMVEQRQVLSTEREQLALVEDQARHVSSQFRQQATEAGGAPGRRTTTGRPRVVVGPTSDGDRGPASAARTSISRAR